MVIDLFTVFAQIVNFLILIFLLKKLLFDRIISIIDGRENEINEQIASAELKEKKAAKELEKQKEIREKLELEWDTNLTKIKKEIQEKRVELLQEARESIEQSQQEWERAINAQRDDFLKEMRELSCQQVLSISKKVLADLANAKLEEQLIKSFVKQLDALDTRKREEFKWRESEKISGRKDIKVEINSVFSLSEEAKKMMTEKIKELIHKDAMPVFNINEKLVCGIEIKTEDKKIGWNMEHYLNILESGMNDIFTENKDKEINSHERKKYI